MDDNGELIIELKELEIHQEAADGNPPQGKLIDRIKTYRDGEVIFFEDAELQLVLVTIASFADSLFKSVADFARTTKEGQAE